MCPPLGTAGSQRWCFRYGDHFGFENLRYLNLATWGPTAPSAVTHYENTQQGSGLNPRRGMSTAYHVRRHHAEPDNLSASSGRGSDAIPSLPHTSRVPVSKGIRFYRHTSGLQV